MGVRQAPQPGEIGTVVHATQDATGQITFMVESVAADGMARWLVEAFRDEIATTFQNEGGG
jgi:hypothetical protein